MIIVHWFLNNNRYNKVKNNKKSMWKIEAIDKQINWKSELLK